MSFLDLPGELRNHIYNLIIPDTSGFYTEVVDLDPDLSPTLPVVAFSFTCKEVQRELLPLYFRAINLRLEYYDPPWPARCVERSTFALMKAYEAMNPTIVDQLRSLRLESESVECIIQVTTSRAMHVELFTASFWIPPTVLTRLSIEIRAQIVDSLSNSPTGLLGIRHLAIPFQTSLQIDQWYEWAAQEQIREVEKMREAPWHALGLWGEAYKDYLVEQAEEEGMPRLILATTSLQDTAEMYD